MLCGVRQCSYHILWVKNIECVNMFKAYQENFITQALLSVSTVYISLLYVRNLMSLDSLPHWSS